mmetsp:Transcript_9072/g.19733  ORF Transcript_9072/g.19733 Transcript_9072/m.19733 type:complete len:227 (-) Transcript_9072:2079-2759(-)
MPDGVSLCVAFTESKILPTACVAPWCPTHTHVCSCSRARPHGMSRTPCACVSATPRRMVPVCTKTVSTARPHFMPTSPLGVCDSVRLFSAPKAYSSYHTCSSPPSAPDVCTAASSPPLLLPLPPPLPPSPWASKPLPPTLRASESEPPLDLPRPRATRPLMPTSRICMLAMVRSSAILVLSRLVMSTMAPGQSETDLESSLILRWLRQTILRTPAERARSRSLVDL